MHLDVNQPSPHIDCFFIEKRMGDLLDLECPPWLRIPMEDHIRNCRSCRRLKSTHIVLAEILRALPRQELSQARTAELLASFEKKKTLSGLIDLSRFPKPARIALEVTLTLGVFSVLIWAYPRLRPELERMTTNIAALFQRETPAPVVLSAFIPQVEDTIVYDLFFSPPLPHSFSQGWNPGPRTLPANAEQASPTLIAQPEPTQPPTSETPKPPEPVVATQIKTTPPVTPVSRPSTDETSEASATQNATESFSFFTLTMVSANKKSDLHTQMLTILSDIQATKAKKSEFGEILNGGLYYHFFVSNQQFEILKQRMGKMGSFSTREKPSSTFVPKDHKRVAVWIGFGSE